MKTKKCKICLVEKEENIQFFIFRNDSKKFRPECKDCYVILKSNYYLENREKINKARNGKPKNDPTRVADRARSSKYYKQNTDYVKKKIAERNLKNPEYMLNWCKNNRDKINKSARKWQKQEKINNPAYKLRCVISPVIRRMLKTRNSNKKGISFLKCIGYSIQELKEHLEKQFEPWMNWQNWGKYNPNTWNDNNQSTWTWQMDHIIPHSFFKYTSMEDDEFKRCWSLNNLRPLSSKQNIKDGARR